MDFLLGIIICAIYRVIAALLTLGLKLNHGKINEKGIIDGPGTSRTWAY
jgi:hypothetical protein